MPQGSPPTPLATSLELPCGLRQDPQAARCARCGARTIGVCGALDDAELNELNRLAVALSAWQLKRSFDGCWLAVFNGCLFCAIGHYADSFTPATGIRSLMFPIRAC